MSKAMSSGNKTKLSFATRSVHAGYDSADNQGSLNPPIYMTSTYTFDNVAQGAGRFSGDEPGHFYSRISNPTVFTNSDFFIFTTLLLDRDI